MQIWIGSLQRGDGIPDEAMAHGVESGATVTALSERHGHDSMGVGADRVVEPGAGRRPNHMLQSRNTVYLRTSDCSVCHALSIQSGAAQAAVCSRLHIIFFRLLPSVVIDPVPVPEP